MTDPIPTNQWTPTPQTLSAAVTGQVEFKRSDVSVREHRAREQADRTIKEFSERFTEKGFFPQDDEGLVFALLPQLADWPADLVIYLLNEDRDLIASWAKGKDHTVIRRNVTLVKLSNGGYAALRDAPELVDDPEAFFQLILRQLPDDLRLGPVGDFNGGVSSAGRIVTLREQIAALVRSERAQLFDALLADDAQFKNFSDISHPNPFLPLWKKQPTDRSPVVNRLLAFYPEIRPKLFEALLEQCPLSDAQTHAFLEEDDLPDPFIEALQQSTEEWSKDRGLDGVFHTRTYNRDADELAREFGKRLLKERFDYELIITEPWQASYEPSGPDDTAIVLKHDGRGNYRVQDLRNGEVNRFGAGTDSFYQAIGSALPPHLRVILGMQSETDVARLRTTLGNLAATANGGWYDPENDIEVKNDLLPKWIREASVADKLLWTNAWQDYRQALVEAQAPGLPDISQYGSAEHLRSYAKAELELRLSVELGLALNPDNITVETTESTPVVDLESPPSPSGSGHRFVPGGIKLHTTRRSLTQLCLDNLRIEDLNFWLTARFLDSNNHSVTALSTNYVHGLVRELNVGDSYVQFLRQRLLTSPFGQWCRDRYAQVMATQMRLDAIEAKMAMDFLEEGKSPPGQTDRGYKWVRAVIDHPVDDGNRGLVEGHLIRVQPVRLQYASGQRPQSVIPPRGVVSQGASVVGLSGPHGVSLEGLLIIAPESRLSVWGIVIYTPSAPDGVRFREFSSYEEMEHHLIENTGLRDYLVSLVGVEYQADVRTALNSTAERKVLRVVAQPPVTDDIYFAHYEAEVRKVIAQVEAQTTSTSEANWNSAWKIASTLAELALEFAPFKVALPIAAARSLFAFSQGVLAVSEGNRGAEIHFTQAVLLLADGLPGAKKSKSRRATSLGLDPKKALSRVREGGKLRSDGVYNGVYEKSNAVGPSDFYAQQSGKTFPISYDTENATWRMIDPRRPDAFYRVPVRFDGYGSWIDNPVGLRGGMPKKGAKGNPSPEKPGQSGPSTSGGKKLLSLDMEGFYESKEFKNAQKGIQDDLQQAVEKAVQRYQQDGNGFLHRSAGGLRSLDLPGIGGSTGRGKWRLMFLPPKDGILKAHSVMDPH